MIYTFFLANPGRIILQFHLSNQTVRWEVSDQWKNTVKDHEEAFISFHVLTLTGLGVGQVQVNDSWHLLWHKIISLFSSPPFASSLTNKPDWQKIKESTYLPPSIKTARSTTITSRLPWEESPHTTRPPSVSPSEGSTAAPSDGSSMYEGPAGKQSTATPSETRNDNYFVQKFKTRPR